MIQMAENSRDSSPDTVVEVHGLRKAYAGRVVVHGLDLHVDAGEVFGLIGANGAGKTTTVECIQGLRSADSGTIRVLDCDPVTQAGRLRTMLGSQLQDSALPDRLRVREAIDLFARTNSHRGDALLEQFGLVARRDSAFASLSGGERQRLFLVLALLNDPSLVVLDELTQGLDPSARREVWAAIAQLRDAGTTVLLVTHEMEEAEVLCNRVSVMRSGRILDSGTPQELVGRHAPWASVTFSWPEPGIDELVAGLRRLPGVEDVGCVSRVVTVHGERQVIAQVGAELVRRDVLPPDLSVRVPDLEAALLRLLDDDARDDPDTRLSARPNRRYHR